MNQILYHHELSHNPKF